MPNRSQRLAAVLLGALLAFGACSGRGPDALTTPTSTGAAASRGGITVQRRGFDAGGGSGIVASRAVDTHTTLYIYRSSDPGLRGEALAADLIARPPRWTVPLDRPGATTPVNVEGVAFGYGSHDLTLLAENRGVFLVPAAAYMGG